ncbi:MAG: 1-acyl-sn-glycerol-3-phosphate acyltransferase [Bacteroidetes bacterium]|nr:1-acyl-sn-glycerol-3-phosphate acyltransferase [Bacteroidota bacterium]
MKFLLVLWRVWFYFISSILVVLMFPLLALLLIFPNGYRPFFWIARNVWSRLVLLGMGFRMKKVFKTSLDPKKSYLLVANHSSYIDIMLMFAAAPNPFVFVGKKELVKIPFFGYLYKRAAIMVDRSSSKSRYGVYGRARKVLDKGYSVCIFPEKDYVDESILLNPFKKGAFRIAVEHQLPICPMVFLDCKRKFPWYTTHGYPGILRVDIHPPLPTAGLTESHIPELQQKTYDLIHSELVNDPQQKAMEAIEVWKKHTRVG